MKRVFKNVFVAHALYGVITVLVICTGKINIMCVYGFIKRYSMYLVKRFPAYTYLATVYDLSSGHRQIIRLLEACATRVMILFSKTCACRVQVDRVHIKRVFGGQFFSVT